MVKEAVGLNLKYLCKCGDYKDPLTYKGSGTRWLRILGRSNCEVKTTILGVYNSAVDLRKAGEFYSDKFNVVKSLSWANLIPEMGDGGPTVTGKVRAYNIKTLGEKFFNDEESIPRGWRKGAIRGQRSAEAIEKTRLGHLGKKRSDLARKNMQNANRRKRMTIVCQHCTKLITPQNIKRHERAHGIQFNKNL